LKVVFDTNIFVSAFVLPGSRADIALTHIVDGLDELVLSKPIIEELLSVLARKFSKDADELAHVAVFLTDLASVTRPRRKIRVLADDADNRILECAFTGNADAIVTGDRAMLALGTFEGIRVISLRDYLEGSDRT
jgi:putative PIN family toxin of toxin-antitoxin system